MQRIRWAAAAPSPIGSSRPPRAPWRWSTRTRGIASTGARPAGRSKFSRPSNSSSRPLDFDSADFKLYGAKVLQFFTSCDARRLDEDERLSWWQFLQGDDYSRKFQRQLRAVPRAVVAMDPQRGSARTIGTTSMQLILDFATAGMANDRTLGGPTSEMWIDPWIAHLQSRGVQLEAGVTVEGIDVDGGRISGVRVAGDPVAKAADFYVLAVPIDQAIAMITPQMAAIDHALEKLRTSNADDLVSWMVGAQYFLKEDVQLVRGHTFYPDSPWALTSISQAQFWTEGGAFRDRYGDGPPAAFSPSTFPTGTRPAITCASRPSSARRRRFDTRPGSSSRPPSTVTSPATS